MKKVLNVGGGSKSIALPPQYAAFEHLLLDIDPKGQPDIVCDARQLSGLPAAQFDAVYCSHNLEHYYRHDVPRVLAGILHVMKDGGFVQIRVPDLTELMRVTVSQGLDVDDVLYTSPAGPVMILDVLYGHSPTIERSGEEFFAHKTGFTQKSLSNAVARAGFSSMFCMTGNLEINLIAFKGKSDPEVRALFGLPEGNA